MADFKTLNGYNVKDEIARNGVNNVQNNLNNAVQNINNDIQNLQGDIDNLADEIPSKRRYILIGDSYAVGIDGDNNTQRVSGGGWGDRFKAMATYTDVYFKTEALGGVYGFASSRPFLEVLQATEQEIDNKDLITDIVVLGGTNDLPVYQQIEPKIQEFCTYAKSHFPNAEISIGVLGVNIPNLYSRVLPEYQKCTKYGAKFIHDTVGLFCFREYVGADGTHLNLNGYTFYQQYINEAILTGNCHFHFNLVITQATLLNTFSNNHEAVYWEYDITENSFRLGLIGNTSVRFTQISKVYLTGYAGGLSQDALNKIAEGCPVILPLSYARVQHPIVYSSINGNQKIGELSIYENNGDLYATAWDCDSSGSGSVALFGRTMETIAYNKRPVPFSTSPMRLLTDTGALCCINRCP